jgi:hypothetical protein
MKNIIKKISTFLLLVFMFQNILAQQGNVSAGGDISGSTGSLSYSIGQTDYLIYNSEQGSLSFGLQQVWHSGTAPPQILEIFDMIISEGESLCFNATETVIVVGDGYFFTVLDGGHAEIIAGQNIVLKYGTSIENGGRLHAYISHVWCEPEKNMLSAFEEKPMLDYPTENLPSAGSFFKVYPNPTNGEFTVELFECEGSSKIIVEIYSMQGQFVLVNELPIRKFYNYNLSTKQPGFYLVRVIQDDRSGIAKIIKQ